MEISGGLSQNLASSFNTNQQQLLQPEANNRVTSKTAPARLEGFDDENDDSNALFKVLKSSTSLQHRIYLRIIESTQVHYILQSVQP